MLAPRYPFRRKSVAAAPRIALRLRGDRPPGCDSAAPSGGGALGIEAIVSNGTRRFRSVVLYGLVPNRLNGAMLEAKPLLTGLVIGESPRWHEGRLWFGHWGAGEIVALDLEGRSEIVGEGPPGLGWSIDWLHD